MSPEQKEKIIQEACKAAGLASHIKWIREKRDANTMAEEIAVRHLKREKGPRYKSPVKSGYMYCDTLDMTFYFDAADTPSVAFAGYATVNSKDIQSGALKAAFEKAEQVLALMRELTATDISLSKGEG